MSESRRLERPWDRDSPTSRKASTHALCHSGLSRRSRSRVLDGGRRCRADARLKQGARPPHTAGSPRAGGTAGATKAACVLRGEGKGVVTDGPFVESKEQLLGFYVIDCADRDAAIAAARELRQANPSAMYEIRPVRLYRPGLALSETD